MLAPVPLETITSCVRSSGASTRHGAEAQTGYEREHPSQERSETFVRLLSHAHDRDEISEDYLVSLQNLMVANPLDRAFTFRAGQNRLRNSSRGARGVTYLPPPPLFHKVACADPRLANGFVFPVSTAMQRNEADYLRALHSFARPIYRALNRHVDLNNNDLVLLVRSMATHGSLSRNRYRQLVAKGHAPPLIDAAVQVATEAMASVK